MPVRPRGDILATTNTKEYSGIEKLIPEDKPLFCTIYRERTGALPKRERERSPYAGYIHGKFIKNTKYIH